MKPPKETRRVEGGTQPERSSLQGAKTRTQGRYTLPPHLERVKEAAKKDGKTRFTALLHHVNAEALARAFERLNRNASPGVDGETIGSYAKDLPARLRDLCDRVHSGRYRPQPVRRAYIPKADGGERPLGILVLEDKIVQSAVAEVLSAIYEVDFLGFSYGFRPKRNPHGALSALFQGLMTQPINWVLDADIRKFFDSVDHEWLLRMVAHRIADQRILRLIRRWLKAGVLESGEWLESKEGTPQGAGISPLLANIFLHYVFDLWVHRWRQRQAHGRVIVVRYADDFVMGFQSEAEARKLWSDLKERFAQFGLTLHEDKTRLLEFGRHAAERRAQRGEKRPETFDFLGFTHICGTSRTGRFLVKRKTQSKRLSRKLTELREKAFKRMHMALQQQQLWLARVLKGHYAYFGLGGNDRSINAYYWGAIGIWYRTLGRRSQRGMTWARFTELLKYFPLPLPKITHPWTEIMAVLR